MRLRCFREQKSEANLSVWWLTRLPRCSYVKAPNLQGLFTSGWVIQLW
jgi:hypothetical protein